MIIFNNTSADVLLKMIIILIELRIMQLFFLNERTLEHGLNVRRLMLLSKMTLLYKIFPKKMISANIVSFIILGVFSFLWNSVPTTLLPARVASLTKGRQKIREDPLDSVLHIIHTNFLTSAINHERSGELHEVCTHLCIPQWVKIFI